MDISQASLLSAKGKLVRSCGNEIKSNLQHAVVFGYAWPGSFAGQFRITPLYLRRCWTRSEGPHGEKIKNGSFAFDLRFVHISRYAIKIPGEIV